VPSPLAARTQGQETAERVPLAGTAHGRALAGQCVEVERHDDGATLLAPVTNRGEAMGVLELSLPEAPSEQTMADVGVAAHALAYVVIAAPMAAGADLHRREGVQHLIRAVLQATETELTDDATALCLDGTTPTARP
jgi:hypothetical protein